MAESMTQKMAKKAKFKNPSGAGPSRDDKLKKAEEKAMSKTSNPYGAPKSPKKRIKKK